MGRELGGRRGTLIGAILCQFCVGMLYSWSVFQKPLSQALNQAEGAVSLAFSLSTFMLPVAMIVAGGLLPRWGPYKVALLGGSVLTSGLIYAGWAKSLAGLYLGYGLLGGIGVGLVYGVPIATCAGWFPECAGTITGLAVAGFGLGSCIYAPIATALVSQIGPLNTFYVQAAVTLVGIALGSAMLKAPPKSEMKISNGHTPGKMLHTGQFWLLLVMYMLANAVGLMLVGHAAPIGQQLAGVSTAQAGVVVSVLAVANTIGRFLGGALSDRFGPLRIIRYLYLINGAAMLLLCLIATFPLYAAVVAVLACSFGGMVGAYPSIVLGYYGKRYYSINYGIVFLAFGFGGLLGPQTAAWVLRTQGGRYGLAFIFAGCAGLLGAGMTLLLKRPTLSRDSDGEPPTAPRTV